jgi:hypothetical protein
MAFYVTFNNISVISWRVNFIGVGNWSTRSKPPTCRKSFIEKNNMYMYVYSQVLGCLRYIPPHFKMFLRLGKTDACQAHIKILTMKDNK